MSDGDEATNVGAKRRFQFSLRQLLWATVACSFACALVFQWGWAGFATCFVLACCFALCWGVYRNSWEWIGISLVGLAFSACLGLPGLGSGPKPARRMQCGNHLKQIGIALHNYHDVYGSFPPPLVTDANGKPMHSWRMLILPFCESKSVYDRYDFSEPWDGPNNSKLAAEMPDCFRCPARSEKQPKSETSYAVVTGPQTMWPGERATKISDIADKTSDTIMVVEVADSGIHWMEPRDLHVAQMPMAINPARGQGISSPHAGVALAVYADGHSQALTSNTPPEILPALLTIAGGETIGDY